jgi:transcription initiation factor IIF auxiliary subunit
MSTDIEELKRIIQQYVSIKEQKDLLAKRESELKATLTEAVEASGEVDGKGHIVLEIDEPVTGVSRLVKQRKLSKPLDMEVAEQLLEEKGLMEECTVMVRQLDQDAIMAAYYKEQLTESDIDAMFPPKITYAFILGK